MRILVAPDKFKDAISAPAACDAIKAGISAARPAADIRICPLGDGGEGTGPLLASALEAQPRITTVKDPLKRVRQAHFWFQKQTHTAIVEMAEASGLWLLPAHQRLAMRTTSFGTGQLLAAARDAGAGRVYLCIGGSATVDGGAGCLQALGWQLLDADGRVITEPVSGGSLPNISNIRPPESLPALDIEVLCDVTNPLLGPHGAAATYGPQKGAQPADVVQLEAGLSQWADVLAGASGSDLRALPGAGAAGGIAFGLAAALNARLVPGFDCVADHLKLNDKLSGCQLCLTGEGCLDEQTIAGKVVAGVAQRARAAGVPVVALVGATSQDPGSSLSDLARKLGLHAIQVITPSGTPLKQALAETPKNLRTATAAYLTENQESQGGRSSC
ncbi:MAG: glycerate kinase [Planctomycetota bacterium]